MILKKNIEIKNNMKNILLILLTFLTLNCYSQSPTIVLPNVKHIPPSELEDFFLAIDTLREQDSIKTVLISDLELQLKNYTLLTQHDSLILNYKNQEILILKDQMKLYNNRLNQVDKWYKKPWFGVVSGVVGTLVTIHIIDYSLPK
tara:strand:+ start:1202 stop:1639 length:438 start_codon:yes stop_codon:yes gene_type:complete